MFITKKTENFSQKQRYQLNVHNVRLELVVHTHRYSFDLMNCKVINIKNVGHDVQKSNKCMMYDVQKIARRYDVQKSWSLHTNMKCCFEGGYYCYK